MIFKKSAVREKRSVGSLFQFRWYPPYGIICSRQQLKRITNGETSHSSASRAYRRCGSVRESKKIYAMRRARRMAKRNTRERKARARERDTAVQSAVVAGAPPVEYSWRDMRAGPSYIILNSTRQ